MNRARPLAGRAVAVTREPGRTAELVGLLDAAGAEVVPCPLTRPAAASDPAALARAAARIRSYDWVVFTSAGAVDRFHDALAAADGAAIPPAVRAACIGPATAAALERRGGRAALVAEAFVAEALADALADALAVHAGERAPRILWPRAAGARRVLAEMLARRGAVVDEVVAYRTVPDPEGGRRLRRLLHAGALDVVTLLAASAVESFVRAVGTDPGRALVAVIGPVTADVASRHGLPVAVCAREHTSRGLVRALENHFEEHGG